jgi:hypothetical protein
MNVFVQVCPVCQNKNDLEAIACKHCGAALDDPFLDPGAKTKTGDVPTLAPESIGGWSIEDTILPEMGVAVYVEGVSDPAFVDLRGEFVMGRKVGTTSEGLLDFSPWGAYHLGLSRRHALIRRAERGYEILDLGSVNGTWLNGERLIPHKSYPFASGSHLRLSSLRLFVLYRPFQETK